MKYLLHYYTFSYFPMISITNMNNFHNEKKIQFFFFREIAFNDVNKHNWPGNLFLSILNLSHLCQMPIHRQGSKPSQKAQGS